MNRNRCIIVVPKTTGTAVLRNRIKRDVREHFRRHLQNTPLHIDILIKIHPVKDVFYSKYRMEKALSSWSETK